MLGCSLQFLEEPGPFWRRYARGHAKGTLQLVDTQVALLHGLNFFCEQFYCHQHYRWPSPSATAVTRIRKITTSRLALLLFCEMKAWHWQKYTSVRVESFRSFVNIPQMLRGGPYARARKAGIHIFARTHTHTWVAVKELNLSYYIGETLLFTI